MNINGLITRLRQHFLSPRHPLGMVMVRVGYGLVMFGEIIQFMDIYPLIFQPFDVFHPYETAPMIGFGLWMVAVLGLIFGAWTRTATAVNFAFTISLLGGIRSFEYHHDCSMMAMATLFLFLPVSAAWSVDAWRRKKGECSSRPVLQLHHDLVMFVAVGLVYVDSSFYKIFSPVWRHGLGMWFPSSFPNFVIYDVSFLLDIKLAVMFMGYLALVFEMSFPLVMWWRRSHPVLLLIGLGLHLGIVLSFPIPLFGLGLLAIYMLFVPDKVWERVAPHLTPSSQSSLERWSIEHKLILALMMFCFVSQAYIIVIRTPFELLTETTSIGEVPRIHRSESPNVVEKYWLDGMHVFMGVTNHPVYLDEHYIGYNGLYSLRLIDGRGDEVWVGPFSKRGMPMEENRGRMWAYTNFRLNGPNQPKRRVVGEMKRYSKYWLQQHHLPLHNVRFQLMYRPIDVPTQWEKGWLKGQLDRPWSHVGDLVWDQGHFIPMLESTPKTKPEQPRP